MSSLSSARTTTDETIKQEEFQLAPTSPAKRSKMISNSKHSLHTNLFSKENESPCGSNDEEYWKNALETKCTVGHGSNRAEGSFSAVELSSYFNRFWFVQETDKSVLKRKATTQQQNVKSR